MASKSAKYLAEKSAKLTADYVRRTDRLSKEIFEEISKKSAYARRIDRLSKRIFGEVVKPTDLLSMHVVKRFAAEPREQTDAFNQNFYPPHPMFHNLAKLLRLHGLFRDEHLDFREEIERLKELRGKGTPPIGEGKRAKLKKQGL